ncbi:MAG TPA: valine--tRNA ligase [Desulfomicrobiaceae bacterium]|nr:valine--tRNA ligase [Desulfomicrobiaceae bacterium]
MAEKNLPKGYEPADVEARWRTYWEEHKTFTPDPDGPGEPYSIVIPPPNVTGALHMGHALNITLQDIMCRFMRQQGRKVLWVPGTDHAGIATQNVVERKLLAQGKTREELGREEFVDQVWDWKEEYGGRILNQIRSLGASVDWTRERFTMDEGLSRAVREVFVQLYEEGLIYRGKYIINWCPRCHTALADDEVEYTPNKATLYHIRYPLEDGSGHVVIATVRPETLLGDTAVAVHPEDERYTGFVGKNLILPVMGRRIPVIADTYVDREFGTGCLKITPAHDMNDWELGRRFGLEAISVIDDAGNMNENAPEAYRGMSAEECRARIVEDLKGMGALVAEEEYENKISQCYRCKTNIEPHVSEQWFVSVKPLAEKARKAVENGETTIWPAQWNKTYFNWLDNIRDWCISRQLWWGHRIPVWTCQECGEVIVAKEDPTSCTRCGSANLVQDEDVLDTWFSSALWPFSTLGWPDKTKELDMFYPTGLLVTGFDILFFWVARMMMMGKHFMDKVPFHDVYIHALVRDEHGKKMSKSTGNVIDPLTMIDKYGCDSLRFTLTSFAAMGRDIKLAESRIEGYRHFVNKIWNAARFTLMHLDESDPRFEPGAAQGLHHKWILSRLEKTKKEMAAAVTGYRFNEYAQIMYKFVWNEFCDWYLELIKPELYGEDEKAKGAARACLRQVLSEILLMLHPVVPFVTQEIWTCIPGLRERDIALATYPAARPGCEDDEAEKRMVFLQDLITSVRNIRAELGIAPGLKLKLLVRAGGEDGAFVLAHAGDIAGQARLEEVQAGDDLNVPRGCATAVVGGYEIFVPLEGAVDFETELTRLDKELAKVSKDLDFVTKKLANQGFVANAPAAVVDKEKAKAAEFGEKKEKLEHLKGRLQELMG